MSLVQQFLSGPELAWKAALLQRNTEVKLDPLIDIDMFLMIEKGTRRGIYNSIY